MSSVASLFAVATGIAAFIWLGRSIRAVGTAREAVAAGAVAGALTGLAGGAIQSVTLAGYLSAVLAGYAVPTEFLSIVLAMYIAVASIAVATVGAAVSYAGWHRSGATSR